MGQNGRQTGTREWAVHGEIFPERLYPEGHPQAGEPLPMPVDKGEVEQMAADVANVVTMVGGTALMGADRIIDPYSGLFITISVYWQWHSYAPSSQRPAAPRGQRGGRREAPRSAAAELQREPEPQEPEQLPDEELEEDDDAFMPLSPEERAVVERDEAPVEEPV